MQSPDKPPLRKRLLRWGIELALVLAVFFLLRAWQTPELAPDAFPPMHAITLDGQPVAVPDPQGRPMVIHIWAEWCPVCRMELGGIARLAQDTPMLSMAWKSGSDEAVRAFLRKEGVTLPVVNDPDGSRLKSLNVKAVPLHLVLDGAGHIRFIETGYTTAWGLRARVWWLEHFGEAMPASGH